MAEVATVAGLISFSVASFKACIQGFQFVTVAQNLGNDAEYLRCLLTWQESHLLRWSERAGIDDNPDHSPNPRLNWYLINSTLKQILLLFTDTKELKDRYNINVEEIDNEEDTNSTNGVSTHGSKSRFDRVIAKIKPNYRTQNARVIQSGNNSLKKARWAIHDKEKFEQLIEKLKSLVDQLHRNLEQTDQDFIQEAVMALLRGLVAGSVEPLELVLVTQLLSTTNVSNPKAIASAAGMKELRLMLGVDKTGDEKGAKRLMLAKTLAGSSKDGRPDLQVLKYSQLRREMPGKPQHGREIATYTWKKSKQEAIVVVEWRSVSGSIDETTLEKRVQDLTLLLHNMADPSFHALPCLGYLRDPDSRQFAFIYSIPPSPPERRLLSEPRLRPVLHLLTSPRKPSLSERLRLAFALAETLLQLHTSGWLHKGIRSENVLYLDLGEKTWQSGTAVGPYLTGYEYARADRPDAPTENVPFAPETNIYRHPDLLNPLRPGYKKAYDLYSLGCVFVELALWSRLQDILLLAATGGTAKIDHTKPTSMSEWDQISSARPKNSSDAKWLAILRQVAFQAGDLFEEVTGMCIAAADEGDGKGPDGKGEEGEAGIQMQLGIVEKLKKCHC